jgi:hypothetical protein
VFGRLKFYRCKSDADRGPMMSFNGCIWPNSIVSVFVRGRLLAARTDDWNHALGSFPPDSLFES